MITVRQIERLWNAKSYRKLAAEMLASRPEASLRLEAELGRALPAAALAIIRLDELSQSHHPINRKLLNVLLVGQEADGGWGDPMLTALCVRALTCGRGEGSAVDRGLAYLATMQKTEGVWPREPIRRFPADGFASAFVLFQLGENARFREAVRFDDATHWFMDHATALEPESRHLWERARSRCRHAVFVHTAAA